MTATGTGGAAAGVASSAPLSVPASRRAVARRLLSRIGVLPSAGTTALQGAQRISSVVVGSFQAKRTVPWSVSKLRPSSQGANQEEVASRMAVGTPTSSVTGPILTRAGHSSGPGASASFTTRYTATPAVSTRAKTAKSR